MKLLLVALALLAQSMAKLEAEMPIQRDDLLDKDLRELYARDAENVPGPIAYGAKYMTGGAGEGSQALDSETDFKARQEVKTDSVLPAYCEPPNPCPKGFSAKDGCMEEFENTAEFSREYQARQNCLCDEEHMRDCPNSRDEFLSEVPENLNSLSEAINSYLDSKQIEHHKELTAKKGYQDHDEMREHFPRKKRSIAEHPEHKIKKEYQWLKGERLTHRVAKKGFKTL